jgi:transposase
MIGVDMIGRIRRAYFDQHRPIKEIVRTLAVSRATVRKVVRGQATEFKYERGVQPAPKLGEWVEDLTAILEREAKLPRRERRSTQRLFEELRGRGYDGAHDSVHRFAKLWREERARVPARAFVPMSFAPGEAYQFDWSHETITLQGLPLTIKAAHMKLSHSRMPFVRAYFRETQELVFDAHDKAFMFYGGVCRRGIYDNMKTAVEAIFVGKARQYNRRFLQMCSHHLIEPVACTPAAGWEKGQVENQVGTLRDLLFRPKPRVKSLAELNGWLEDQCIGLRRLAPGVRRRQDDNRHARPPYPPLRHHRDRQHQLALQEPKLTSPPDLIHVGAQEPPTPSTPRNARALRSGRGSLLCPHVDKPGSPFQGVGIGRERGSRLDAI